MRQRLHIILTLWSCCFLYFMQSCTSDKLSDDRLHTDAKDEGSTGGVIETDEPEEDEDNKPATPVETMPPIDGVIMPPETVGVDGLLPPQPLIPWGAPFGGGGGGSGRGNSDEERDHHHKPEEPRGKCGNGVQEVLPGDRECKFRLYGSSNNTNGSISLYGFHVRDHGEGELVGTITGGLSKVYALDFDPQGVLYGLGERTSDSDIVYFSLDCVTAVATILGETGLTAPSVSVTDMDFDSIGRLFAYVNDGAAAPPGDQLGIIDHVLGQIHVGQYIE